MQSIHKTVLLKETIDGLNLRDDSVVVDCTFGGGGHSKEILNRFPAIKIIALDQDNKTKNNFIDERVSFHNSNFRDLDQILDQEGIKEVDGFIFDLGISSDQLESSGRGFSFMRDEPLQMTMKENPSPENLTALDIINTWSEKSLADIIYGYGEEKFSRRIAKAIVESRGKKKIKTTFELLDVLDKCLPVFYKKGKVHFATKTFQALRIAVNDELGSLEKGLEKAFDYLVVNGRISVISFHSLEDRIVKRFFKNKEKEGKGKLINKKPISPKEEEIINNKRSRSAKLRVLEKIK